MPVISHILQNGNYPDVTLKSFPAVCTGCSITDERIVEIIGDNPDQYSKIVVIVSSCRGKKDINNIQLKKAEIIRLEQCLEILFTLPTIYHYIKQGNYLVSNGWLRNYNHHIRDWGFEANSAKNFFGESIRKIVLLETGLPGDYITNLTALSEYMGVPYDILPVGISHLQRFLNSIVLEWKNENQRKSQNNRIAKLARESADYSLVFSHLRNLIDHTDEEFIINEIKNLLNLLFVPGKLVYHQYSNGVETNTTDQASELFNPEDSITIEVRHQNETLGLFEVLKVRFPQFIPQYKPMEQLISQIGGLAIANARKYSELERTRLALCELNATKDKFFSIISHDLRGSFASILSLTGLMADDSYDLSSDDFRNFTLSVHKTAKSTCDLLQNLLEWSRLQKGAITYNPELINLKDFIGDCDESVRFAAVKKMISLEVNIPEGLTVQADVNMFQTIMRNLVMNAIKFTSSGGKVEVEARLSYENVILFSVKDSGIGMSKQILENLFRIDVNVSRQGTDSEPSTGLGLILCKEFVDKHGGQIWAESEVGKGSTFYFTLAKS